ESAIPRTLAWATNPDVSYSDMYPYDPAAARERLEAAGVSGVEIDMPYRSDIPGAQAMVDVIASNLAEIGLSVNLQLQEAALWQDRVFRSADFGMTVVNYTSYS